MENGSFEELFPIVNLDFRFYVHLPECSIIYRYDMVHPAQDLYVLRIYWYLQCFVVFWRLISIQNFSCRTCTTARLTKSRLKNMPPLRPMCWEWCIITTLSFTSWFGNAQDAIIPASHEQFWWWIWEDLPSSCSGAHILSLTYIHT